MPLSRNKLKLRRYYSAWIAILVLFGVAALFMPLATVSAKEYAYVEIADPYIEMHTGPGRGFPIFYIAQRHETVAIIKRKTDWFKVRTSEGKEGWVYLAQMQNTFTSPEVKQQFGHLAFKHFQDRSGEFGIMVGDFEGATIMSIYAGFSLTKNLAVDMSVSQSAGEFTQSSILAASIQASPFPDWRASPFFTLGVGLMTNKPRRTSAFLAERDDNLANAGFGLRYYVTRRLMLITTVKHHVVFVDHDSTGEFLEWKAGVSIFY